MNEIKFNGKSICPSKIVCVGRNYAGHIKELDSEMPDEPVIFLKPNSAIANSLAFNNLELVHYEAELTFLIQNKTLSAVGFGLDLTKRAVQTKLKSQGLPWERAKAFDSSAVFSEFVALHDDIASLSLELFINDQCIQRGGYALMLHKPYELLKEISTFMTLEDGDLLMTGTPEGVGPLVAGDCFVGKVYSGSKLLVEASWQVE